ncbi:hypothetical protein BC936DRAFT_145980 [Jimgerdemannia flammicorona]|uniref:DUF2421 domain-containing protein n=1 Tax=Jimgerdemannia flammicorona TaxID=994334 RepID=A0A433D8N2_9FUNG|nr:hypothetical protein BC936DRAFT_145980 [Jimgerdemannia flammicorona]
MADTTSNEFEIGTTEILVNTTETVVSTAERKQQKTQPSPPEDEKQQTGASEFSNKPASNEPALPKAGFRKFIKNFGTFLSSAAFKNTVKGTLAFWTVALFILIDPVASIFKYQTVWMNVMLSAIVLSPGRTVGDFLDGAFLFIIGGIFGVLAWTLINVISGSNNAGMLVLLSIVIYATSVVRARGGPRMFAFSLVPSIMGFQGLYGAVTQGVFNQTLMLESLYAFFLGIAINTAVNVFLFPHTAETDLRQQLAISCINLSKFNSYIIKTYLLTISPEEISDRDRLSHVLTAERALLTRALNQVDSEVTYSEFSLKDYAIFVRSIHILQQYLLSVHLNIQNNSEFAQNSARFRDMFSTRLKEPLELLEIGARKAMAIIANKFDKQFGFVVVRHPPAADSADPEAQKLEFQFDNVPKSGVDLSEILHRTVPSDDKDGNTAMDPGEVIWSCTHNLRNSVKLFEEKQYNMLFELFEPEFLDSENDANGIDISDDITVLSAEQSPTGTKTPTPLSPPSASQRPPDREQEKRMWESLFACYFFMFGVREFIDEVNKLRDTVIGASPTNGDPSERRKSKLRLHYRHFLPKFRKSHQKSSAPQAHQSPVNPPGSNSRGSSSVDVVVRRRTANSVATSVTTTVTPEQETADKPKPQPVRFRAVRKTLLGMFCFLESKQSIYGVKCTVVIAMVTLLLLLDGPSRLFFQQWNMQSTITTILVCMSPTLGQTYSSFIFQLIGNTFGMVWALVCFGAWGYNPYVLRNSLPIANLVGTPYERSYKAFVVLCIGLGFVFVFSVLLYPNLARRELRIQIAKLLAGVGCAYHSIIKITSTESDVPASHDAAELETVETIAHLRKTEIRLQMAIVRIQSLIKFAAAEPRLEKPFQADIYHRLVALIQVIADRLVTARLCIGPKGFSKEVMRNIMAPTFNMRNTMHTLVQTLLYIYSSSLMSKMELPNELPSAALQRNKLLDKLYEVIDSARIDPLRPTEHILHTAGYIRVYAYHIAMKDCATKIDEIGPLLKHLFGEQEELALLESIHEEPWSEASAIELGEEGEEIQGDARLEHEEELEAMYNS